MHSRARRRFSRGLKRKPMALIKKLRRAKKEAPPNEKPAIVKTHLRNMIVVPEMVGSIIGVYNGKTFNQVCNFFILFFIILKKIMMIRWRDWSKFLYDFDVVFFNIDFHLKFAADDLAKLNFSKKKKFELISVKDGLINSFFIFRLKLNQKWLDIIWVNSHFRTNLLSTVDLVLVPHTVPDLFHLSKMSIYFSF